MKQHGKVERAQDGQEPLQRGARQRQRKEGGSAIARKGVASLQGGVAESQ